MKAQFTIKEFLKLTAVQKNRLYQNDRQQYDRLAAAVKENYDPETDTAALAELTKNPKTKHLTEKE